MDRLYTIFLAWTFSDVYYLNICVIRYNIDIIYVFMFGEIYFCKPLSQTKIYYNIFSID